MRIGSLFTGYGGLDMAVERFFGDAYFGAQTVWTSDIDPGACKIIAHRMPHSPNLGDITEIDWRKVEPIDVLTGGFPCQDLSHAGKRLGLKPGTRSGLWSHMAYAISQLRPRYVIAENVRGLLSASAHSDLEPCPWCVGGTGDGEPDLRALGAVLGDLAELGYVGSWIGVRAADVGAPHGRFRVFVVATDTQYSELQGVGSVPGLGFGSDARSHVRLLKDASTNASRERHGGGQDAGSVGRVDSEDAGLPREREWPREVASDRGATAAADSTRNGRHEGRPEPARLVRGSHAALSGDAFPDADRDGQQGVGRLEPVRRDPDGCRGAHVAWGDYEPAIRRWEAVLDRPAPAPTETGPKGGQRLSPRFVEWMMGLPAGWVTDVPNLSRNAQLKALGNGVVPQQAYEALHRAFAIERAA